MVKKERSKKYTPKKPEREVIPFDEALARIWSAKKKSPKR